MTLLAIDTSERACSVALVRAGETIDHGSELIGRGHAERLLPLIEEKLAKTGLTYRSLSRVAVMTGPGTFTGLRIGLSVARGLALQRDIPCIGLTGLQVLAATALDYHPGETACAVIAGRGGQVFLQKFVGTGSLPEAVSEVSNLDLEDAIQEIAQTGAIVITTSGEAAEALKSLGIPVQLLDAIDVSKLGLLSETLDPEDHLPEPTYFRAADAKKATAVFPVAGQ